MPRKMKSVINTIYESKLAELKSKIDTLHAPVKLTIVTVGDDPASKVYVRNKIRLFDELGLECNHVILAEESTKQADLDVLAQKAKHPILFQLPLPNGLIAPDLPAHVDVDGFGSEARGPTGIRAERSSSLHCTSDDRYYFCALW